MRLSPLVFLACLVLAACTHTVPVTLATPADTTLTPSTELAAVKPPLTFRRGHYTDRRPDTTRLATFQQGIHTYNLYGDRPIADDIFDGLRVLLTRAGQRWLDGPDSTTADLRTDLELLNVQASRNAGMFNVGATSSLQIKLDFVDAHSGRIIYTSVYNGTDQRSRPMVGLMGMVRESINASVESCLNSVGHDAGLSSALRQAYRP